MEFQFSLCSSLFYFPLVSVVAAVIIAAKTNMQELANNPDSYIKGESKKKGLALRLNYVRPDEFCAALTYRKCYTLF